MAKLARKEVGQENDSARAMMMQSVALNVTQTRCASPWFVTKVVTRLGLPVVCLLLMCHSVWAQDDGRAKSKLPPMTADREAAAMEFVQEHQPELARLLEYLRRKQPRQYQRAVRELARTADRLKQTRARDPRRYELELQGWQNRSRIDLLAAKWQVQPDEKLKERLRTAIAEQLALQKQILEREREKVSQRLRTVDAQLEKLNTTEEAEIERRLKAATEGRRNPLMVQPNGAKGSEQRKKDSEEQKRDGGQ